MNDDQAQKTVLPDPEKAKGLTDKLGLKSEYAGENIKDMADKAGIILGIGSIVTGFLIGNRFDNPLGLLIALMLMGAGIFFAYVLTSLLYSYGDMIANSFEQTKILKNLEAKKLSELSVEEVNEQQAADAEAVEQVIKPLLQPEPDIKNDQTKLESNIINLKPVKTADIKTPLRGVIDTRMRRIAYFSERSPDGVICPICDRQQDSNRDNCYFCDCKFVYNDELLSGDDNVLDRLGRFINR